MDGFCRRMWKSKVDTVGSPRYGLFLVRFHTEQDRDEVLNGGYLFFNNRPVVMKAWDVDMDLSKNNIRIVPIWIQLEELDLKYWGERALFKIVGQIGEPLQVDAITKGRMRLSYPRVLVEVQLDQHLPDRVLFEDERGRDVKVSVRYDWKPNLCRHCKGIGHETDKCRKKEPAKQQWVVKPKVTDVEKDKKRTDAEGFQVPIRFGKVVSREEKQTPVTNSFQVLEAEQGSRVESITVNGKGKEVVFVKTGEGGGPSTSNG